MAGSSNARSIPVKAFATIAAPIGFAVSAFAYTAGFACQVGKAIA